MRARARDLGVRLGTLEPGPRNTIADVGEVRVGHVTLVEGEGKLVPGKGPVRTGVTVVVPHRGNVWRDRPKAAWETINGCGELTGALEIREFGSFGTPIGLTNTMCVSNVGLGLIEATLDANPDAAIDVGTVGAGTGMITCDYKGGIGSASRRLGGKDGGWALGALVLSNFGWREHLTIAGVPVGRELLARGDEATKREGGASIVIVLATDAPLSSRQL